MMMDDYKNFDNFQRTEGCKMISPHHSHPTKGVRPVDSNIVLFVDMNGIAHIGIITAHNPVVLARLNKCKT